MKNGEFVSLLTNGFQWINKDERKSKRWLLVEASIHAATYMAQHQKDIFRDSSLFTTIECFPMKPDNVVNCDIVQFRKCEKLMKSVNKLPETIGGKMGGSLVKVYNLDYTEEFRATTLMDWQKMRKRKNFDLLPSKNFAFDLGGHLFIPNSEVERVNIIIITTDPEATFAGDCCGCESVWEKEFKCPDKYLQAVLIAIRQSAGLTEQVQVDENPNMDENIKSRTIQT